MILVTGSTGKIGQHLIPALKAKGLPFKALARSSASLEGLRAQGVATVQGDLADLGPALGGAHQLFLLSAGSDFDRLEIGAIHAAKAAGVKRIVKISATGVSADAFNPLFRAHARAERALEDSGIAFTILRPNFFMQNWLSFFAPGIKAGQPVYVNAGEGRLAWIDTRDIAAAAAAALSEPGHDGLVYDLTGPEALSYGDVADRLGKLLGRPVGYVPVPDAAAFQAMQGMGMDAWYAYGMVTLHQGVRRGLAEATTGTLELITGQAPRGIDAFLQEHLADFS